jgi:hypothetical protein
LPNKTACQKGWVYSASLAAILYHCFLIAEKSATCINLCPDLSPFPLWSTYQLLTLAGNPNKYWVGKIECTAEWSPAALWQVSSFERSMYSFFHGLHTFIQCVLQLDVQTYVLLWQEPRLSLDLLHVEQFLLCRGYTLVRYAKKLWTN